MWYTETEDSLSVYATTTAPDNSSVFELLRTTLTAGQTSITSYSTANIKYAQPQQSVVPYAGNPNGKVAGVQGGNGISPTIVWDTNDNILWFCTTTGTASSAVWQGLAPLTGNSNYAFNVANASTSTEAVPLGQAQADFAAINGSASEVFNVANATTSTEAVPLGQFPASLGSNGYQKLPSGLIIQWGNGVTDSTGTVQATFPVAFPNAVLNQNVSVVAASSPKAQIAVAGEPNTTGCYYYCANTSGTGISGIGLDYIVIGY